MQTKSCQGLTLLLLNGKLQFEGHQLVVVVPGIVGLAPGKELCIAHLEGCVEEFGKGFIPDSGHGKPEGQKAVSIDSHTSGQAGQGRDLTFR